MEWLDVILQRPVIIGLAIAGAIIATFGSFGKRERSRIPKPLAHWCVRIGYAITWSSVALFIVAGFRSAYV